MQPNLTKVFLYIFLFMSFFSKCASFRGALKLKSGKIEEYYQISPLFKFISSSYSHFEVKEMSCGWIVLRKFYKYNSYRMNLCVTKLRTFLRNASLCHKMSKLEPCSVWTG